MPEKTSWITSTGNMQKIPPLFTLAITLFPAIVLSIARGLKGDFVTVGNFTGAIMIGLYSVYSAPHVRSGIKERRFSYFGIVLHAFVMVFGILCIFDVAQDRIAFLRPGVSFKQGFCSDPIRIRLTEIQTAIAEDERGYNRYMERVAVIQRTLESQASALGVKLNLNTMKVEQ